MRADLSVVGPQFTRERRVAASATRYEAGELLIFSSLTYSTGIASANTCTLAAADAVVLGTDYLAGVPIKGASPFKTGTLVAHKTTCACPIPNAGIIRGKAETAASVDTDAELLLLINDLSLIDYAATGGSDGGELYTIKEAAAADTHSFTIVGGNPARATLDVVCHPNIYRTDVS